jgi:hypothetical protein
MYVKEKAKSHRARVDIAYSSFRSTEHFYKLFGVSALQFLIDSAISIDTPALKISVKPPLNFSATQQPSTYKFYETASPNIQTIQ